MGSFSGLISNVLKHKKIKRNDYVFAWKNIQNEKANETLKKNFYNLCERHRVNIHDK